MPLTRRAPRRDEPFVTVGNSTPLTAERALTGTTNQITVTDGGANGAATLSTPQNIHTAATPQFAQIGIGGAAVASQQITALAAAATDKVIIVKGAASQSANLQEWQNSSAAILGHVKSDGSLSLGTVTYTGTSGVQALMAVDARYNPTGANSGTNAGLSLSAYTQSGNAQTMTNLFGLFFNAEHYGTNTLSNGYGLQGKINNRSSGTISLARGIYAIVQNLSSGTITNGYGVYVDRQANSGGGVFTTSYGLYINTQDRATTNYAIFTNEGLVRFGDNVGISVVPAAKLHIAAGTATAGTAPLRFTSGTNLTSAVAGTVEFTTDDLFFTITTGAARKAFVLDDGTRLTSGRVPVATTNGRLTDDADLTFSGSRLTATDLTVTNAPIVSSLTAGRVVFAGASKELVDDADLTFSGDTLTTTKLTTAGQTIFGAPARLKAYTVATLPAGTQGDTAFVTDALAPTFLAALVGGGAVVTPAFYDGTNWVSY